MIDHEDGMILWPAKSVEVTRPPDWYLVVKRVVDVVASLLLLLPALPLLGLLGLAVKLDSRGPVFFSQMRVGRHAKGFKIHKLRTMETGAPEYSLKISSTDPVVTRFGRFLRVSGLDELPQLFNVLKGDMSLVGPRPEQPFIFESYEDWQRQRCALTPGLTGWWQIHHRNEVPLHLGIAYDLFYIENMGPRLDFVIAARTVWTVARAIGHEIADWAARSYRRSSSG